MITCPKCKIAESLSNSCYCRECRREYNRAQYQKRKQMMHDKYHLGGYKKIQAQRYRDNSRYRQMVSRCSRLQRKGKRYDLNETFTVDDFEAVFARFDNKCFNCGTTDRDLQVDHHVPQILGVILTHTNAVILCDACNGRKSCQLPEDFYSAGQIKALNKIFAQSND